MNPKQIELAEAIKRRDAEQKIIDRLKQELKEPEFKEGELVEENGCVVRFVSMLDDGAAKVCYDGHHTGIAQLEDLEPHTPQLNMQPYTGQLFDPFDLVAYKCEGWIPEYFEIKKWRSIKLSNEHEFLSEVCKVEMI